MKHLLSDAITTELIQIISDFFPTKELIAKIRPLNKLFN